jgi:c(7)-type cytochrome triheme protein
LAPPEKRTPILKEDGIHDPASPAIGILQEPKEAFLPLEKSTSGNRVDWVKSLNNAKIQPLYDRKDPTKQPMPMNLNIVMEVKGSMPNVVFGHKAHVAWLDCVNCHPKIFQPQKGANQISMAQIMLGESCGVCHGTVAFPVTECRRCHSQEKQAAAAKDKKQ